VALWVGHITLQLLQGLRGYLDDFLPMKIDTLTLEISRKTVL